MAKKRFLDAVIVCELSGLELMVSTGQSHDTLIII